VLLETENATETVKVTLTASVEKTQW